MTDKSTPRLTEQQRRQLDAQRDQAKADGKPAPMMLSNNMVRALDKLFGISPEATEEFIRNHPSPFGD
jgi:hypothetical protein